MKIKLLSAVIAATAVTSATQALAGFPTVYGKVNLTLNKYSLEKLGNPTTGAAVATGAAVIDELDNWSLESNASRIGIKGDYDIHADLKAIYKLEYGIDVDNGTNANGREFTQRNIYGGFQSNTWGTLIAGKNDTPLKLIQTNTVTQTDIDRFNDLPLADIGTYLVGENRADNVIQYASPILFEGLEISIAAIQIEETGVRQNTSTTAGSTTNPANSNVISQSDNGFASGKSIALTYGRSNWYAAVAYDNNVASTDTVRAIGEITLGPVKVGAIYQTAEQHDKVDTIGPFSTFIGSGGAPNGISEWDGTTTIAAPAFKEQDAYIVNAQWKISGPWTAKAQYAQSETTPQKESLATGVQYKDVKLKGVAVGIDYKLNDNAKLFTYYASVDTEGDNRVSTQSTQDKTFAVGAELKF